MRSTKYKSLCAISHTAPDALALATSMDPVTYMSAPPSNPRTRRFLRSDGCTFFSKLSLKQEIADTHMVCSKDRPGEPASGGFFGVVDHLNRAFVEVEHGYSSLAVHANIVREVDIERAGSITKSWVYRNRDDVHLRAGGPDYDTLYQANSLALLNVVS